jgi:hypothetical protein
MADDPTPQRLVAKENRQILGRREKMAVNQVGTSREYVERPLALR